MPFLAEGPGDAGPGERHQAFWMLGFKNLQAFEETTHVMATFRGDFVANPPNLFEDFVFHTV